MAACLAVFRSILRSRAALTLARLASIASFSVFSRCFSALALWIYGLSAKWLEYGRCCSYMFNESSLMLEGVTLRLLVKLVVEMLVDLASSSVLDKKTTKDS